MLSGRPVPRFECGDQPTRDVVDRQLHHGRLGKDVAHARPPAERVRVARKRDRGHGRFHLRNPRCDGRHLRLNCHDVRVVSREQELPAELVVHEVQHVDVALTDVLEPSACDVGLVLRVEDVDVAGVGEVLDRSGDARPVVRIDDEDVRVVLTWDDEFPAVCRDIDPVRVIADLDRRNHREGGGVDNEHLARTAVGRVDIASQRVDDDPPEILADRGRTENRRSVSRDLVDVGSVPVDSVDVLADGVERELTGPVVVPTGSGLDRKRSGDAVGGGVYDRDVVVVAARHEHEEPVVREADGRGEVAHIEAVRDLVGGDVDDDDAVPRAAADPDLGAVRAHGGVVGGVSLGSEVDARVDVVGDRVEGCAIVAVQTPGVAVPEAPCEGRWGSKEEHGEDDRDRDVGQT